MRRPSSVLAHGIIYTAVVGHYIDPYVTHREVGNSIFHAIASFTYRGQFQWLDNNQRFSITIYLYDIVQFYLLSVT